ncbi:MAG: hypothetical protein RL186_1788 [Pseudomonadota bacterium]|jgi:predicted dehydrogenase
MEPKTRALTSGSKLRVGVAGAGVFGANHARKLAMQDGAALIGILDRDLARAQELAATFGAKGYDELEALLADVDALVIATPALAHAEIARVALGAAKHCLVEKPLATNHADALDLCALAQDKGVVLQVGHQERYVFKAMGLLDLKARPTHLSAARLGPPSPRGADVSVTFDLMVHDIDLARLVFGSEPVSVRAKLLAGSKDKADAMEAELVFACGGTAHLVASRAAQARDRHMRLIYDSGEVAVDFIAKTFKDGPNFGLHADFATRIPDAMAAATHDFLAAIRGEIPVTISGPDGAAAVKIAQAIDQAV